MSRVMATMLGWSAALILLGAVIGHASEPAGRPIRMNQVELGLRQRITPEQIGRGFQLQSPVFVTLLAYVLFSMALSGLLLVGGRLAGAAHALASRRDHAGSCFAGTLTTVAATPCTAPFMGVALGIAVTQPWATALVVRRRRSSLARIPAAPRARPDR